MINLLSAIYNRINARLIFDKFLYFKGKYGYVFKSKKAKKITEKK